jgi:hypothetical protein
MNEVGRLDTSTGTFTNYSLPAIDSGLASGQARAIAAAQDGTLWVAEFGGISSPNANAIIRIVPTQPTPTATVWHLGPNGYPFAVAPDTRGNVARLVDQVGEPARASVAGAPELGEDRVLVREAREDGEQVFGRRGQHERIDLVGLEPDLVVGHPGRRNRAVEDLEDAGTELVDALESVGLADELEELAGAGCRSAGHGAAKHPRAAVPRGDFYDWGAEPASLVTAPGEAAGRASPAGSAARRRARS